MANKKNSYDSKPAIANKFLNPTGTTSTLDEIITQIIPGTTLAETTSTPAKEYQSKPAVANKFLNTDGTYSTLDEILGRTIGGITQFDVQVVEELPEVGEKGVLYLVPNEGSGGNIYDEYVWIPSTESFEKIGTTEIDLSGYEQLINKVTSIDDQSTDSQYPSAKLLYDQLGLKLNGKRLVGTSYQYICNKSTDNNYLYSASSSAFGEKLEDGIYEVMGLKYTASGSDNIQNPSVDYGQSILYYVSQQRKAAIPLQLEDQGDGHFPATLSNGVLYQSVIQSKYNKVTSISSSSTDAQYPSAKLLYDQLALKLNATDLGKVPHINLSDSQGTSNVSQYQGCIVFVESLTTIEPQVINDLFWVVPASVPFALRRINPGLGSDGKPYISYLEYDTVDRDAHWTFRSEALMTGTTVVNNSSTDSQYPTAKAVYDQLATKVNKAGDTMTGALTTTAITIGSRASGSTVGNRSFAQGYDIVCSGQDSHAEGQFSEATGSFAHAEGHTCKAQGNASHAEGASNTAQAANSHIEGNNNGTVYGNASHIQGRYAMQDTSGTYAHIVGNGTYNIGETMKRSNAHTLDWNGNAWFSGDVYVGSTGGTNRDAGSIKLAKDVAFTGTDGTSAGTSGLVPNPTVGDVGKYLKADGTWASVPNPSNITQQEIISLFS